MAQVTINIPDNKLSLVVDALDSNYPGRTSETKAQWAKQQVIEFLRKEVRRYELKVAQESATHDDIGIS